MMFSSVPQEERFLSAFEKAASAHKQMANCFDNRFGQLADWLGIHSGQSLEQHIRFALSVIRDCVTK